MKTNNSINNKGCSVCEQGEENYTTVIAGAFRGTEYYNTTTGTPMENFFQPWQNRANKRVQKQESKAF